jgi:hypothetical protein
VYHANDEGDETVNAIVSLSWSSVDAPDVHVPPGEARKKLGGMPTRSR